MMKLHKEYLFYILFCITIISFFSLTLYNSYKQEKTLTEEKISYTSLLISEWINSSFQSSDYILKDMVYTIPISALKYPAIDKKEHEYISKYIEDKQKTVPYSNGVGLSDKNCIVTHTLSIVGFDGKDREWCKMLKDFPDRETFVSNMFVSNNGVFMVIQGRKFPGKNYSGQAGVGVDLLLFRDFLKKVEVSKNSVLAIVDENQKLLARQPSIDKMLGKVTNNEILSSFIKSEKKYQIISTKSPLDGEERLYSLRKVEGLPFIVIIGEANKDWLNNWKEQLYISILIIFIFIFVGWIFVKNHITINNQKNELQLEKEKNRQFTLIGTTISYVTHQWKQPISILSSQIMRIEALIDHKPQTKVIELKEDIKKINENMTFINDTLSSIKTLFKIDTTNKAKFDLEETINLIKINFEEISINKNLKIQINIDGKKNIYGNQNLFIHAIKNIIQNSVDAILENDIKNAKIKIIFNKENLLIIEDNAGGIDKKVMDTLFETSSSKSYGMGIGLSITKDILEKEFKSSISIESIKNGTRFIIR